MTSEPKKWVKPIQQGRMKGVLIPVDQETWEAALEGARIPLDTPIDDVRVTRYQTGDRSMIIRVKHVDKIDKEDLENGR